jgi:hypothetical protein
LDIGTEKGAESPSPATTDADALFLQTSLYVGRGMHESTWSLLKYSLFWVALLTCKALFSYNLQVRLSEGGRFVQEVYHLIIADFCNQQRCTCSAS